VSYVKPGWLKFDRMRSVASIACGQSRFRRSTAGWSHIASFGTLGWTLWKRISIDRHPKKKGKGRSSLDATIEQVGDLYVIRFERRLNHPIDRVWTAITEPEQLKQWLAAADIDPIPGGNYTLHFDNTKEVLPGRIIKYEPPHLFEHTFGEDANGVVRWELSPERDGCKLRLSHTVYATGEMANFLSGWHTHLELLEDVLRDAPRPWSWDRWHEHKARYAERVLVEFGAKSNGI
jgi:uncharacterized protein YndB with AHSA1/START domain